MIQVFASSSENFAQKNLLSLNHGLFADLVTQFSVNLNLNCQQTFYAYDALSLCITTGFIVFGIGITGIFFNRRLVISILLALELTLLSINLLLLTFAATMEDLLGVVFALYVLCVAAAESAIGLALIILWYSVRRSVSVQYINLLKG